MSFSQAYGFVNIVKEVPFDSVCLNARQAGLFVCTSRQAKGNNQSKRRIYFLTKRHYILKC